MRLDKAVTAAGISRKDAKRLIAAGRVTVDDRPARDPGLQLSSASRVALDGETLILRLHTHVMLNKPAGYVSATQDAHGLPVITELLPEALSHLPLGPVGRLDRDVTGLMLLTTDGQLAHRLISPRHGHVKRYEAVCEGRLDESCVLRFAEGMELGDFTAKPAVLTITEELDGATRCLVEISEGKFHQVKRMFEKIGHPIIRLKRVAIAGVFLDEALEEGQCRLLTNDEAARLYAAAGLEME
ncbi:MAG: rRNA pseudouridine synthase [Clostridia bacterium]|nr:rRNA pseudouridine synthase [Clostridia bacterium]